MWRSVRGVAGRHVWAAAAVIRFAPATTACVLQTNKIMHLPIMNRHYTTTSTPSDNEEELPEVLNAGVGDHYEVLHLPRTATAAQIKIRYVFLAAIALLLKCVG
jgi:hypothetical protein